MAHRMRLLGAVLALMLLPAVLPAEIHEIKNMEQVYDYLPDSVSQDILIVLDIDNTLIEPVQQLGRDQWFYHRVEHYLAEGHDARDALEKALREWSSIMNVTRVQLVEPHIDAIVSDLQKQGYPVIGLTTRGLSLATVTVQQLESVGIDLAQTAPHRDDILIHNQGSVLYREGILFTAGTHKGEALRKLLEAIDYSAVEIVFVNDKRSHLEPVAQMCDHQGLEFIGLRYGFIDEHVEQFRPDLAQVQFEHFGHILSDEQADQQLTQSTFN